MEFNSKLKISKQRGSMMVEILVVAAILVATTIVALEVAHKSIYVARQSLHQSQAAFLLEEGVEATRIVRDNAWSQISGLSLSTNYYLSFSGGTWVLSVTPSTIGIFTRTVVFSSAYRDGSQNLASSGTLDAQTKLITVTVSWLEGTQVLSKNLKFYITDLFS
ncbi:MAG: hypothetical protein AAB510_01180 [Patescibacteria group bacterium]